jgi:dihydropyrimidinase
MQVNTGMLSAEEFVRVVSTEAAQVFNIYPQKGIIAAGSDADVIVFDPYTQHTISARTHHSRIDTNVYEGRRVSGKVRLTSLPPSPLLGRCWEPGL